MNTTDDALARKPRPPRRRHPALRGTPVGTFNPAAVGVVRGYPANEEAYRRQREQLRRNSAKARAAGKMTRRGIPNGWAGRRDEVVAIRRNAQTEAEKLTEVVAPQRESKDDELGAEAMAVLFAIAMAPTYAMRDRLAAIGPCCPIYCPSPWRGPSRPESPADFSGMRKLAALVLGRDGAD